MKGLISFGLGFFAACLVFGVLSIADVVQFGEEAKDKYDGLAGDDGNQTKEVGYAPEPELVPVSYPTVSYAQRVLTESI